MKFSELADNVWGGIKKEHYIIIKDSIESSEFSRQSNDGSVTESQGNSNGERSTKREVRFHEELPFLPLIPSIIIVVFVVVVVVVVVTCRFHNFQSKRERK